MAHWIRWVLTRHNLSLGFPTQRDLNQSPRLQRLAREMQFWFVASQYMILSNKRITKMLIRLGGCPDWSAPSLFANSRNKVFSGSCEGPDR